MGHVVVTGFLVALVSLRLVPAGAQADTAAAIRLRDSLITANSYRATFADGKFEGPAHDFIVREAAKAQFVAIGERHEIREIPEITLALLRELSGRYGFNHLATENGEQAIRLIPPHTRASARDSVVAYAARYPDAFEFSDDQDLELVGRAAAILRKSNSPVWGLDQEFGALHLIDRLRNLGVPAPARTFVDSIYDAVRVAELKSVTHGGRHWMALDASPGLFRRLRDLYGATVGREQNEIFTSLEESARIYELNRMASSGQPVGFTANNDREQFMKRNFARFYRDAQKSGEANPKVILKMGQAHLGRGQSPFGPYAVGNLVSELALANGSTSFHIAVLAHNAPADTLAPSLWQWTDMLPIARVTPTSGITVIDLRPLRRFLYSNKVGKIDPDLRRTIYGYDAMMLIGGAKDATETLTAISSVTRSVCLLHSIFPRPYLCLSAVDGRLALQSRAHLSRDSRSSRNSDDSHSNSRPFRRAG